MIVNYPFDCISDFIFVETELKKADIILVPGGSWKELGERAAELYNNGLAPYVLPSGWYNPKVPGFSSEWEFIKETAKKSGVPETAILKEDKASNTFENARLSLKVIEEKGIKVREAIIVCKAYHSRRALLTYQTIFPKDITFYVSTIADNKEIKKDNWFKDSKKIHYVMSEVVKIGNYFESEIPGILEGVEKL